MLHLESVRHKQYTLERKLEKERKRTQRHHSKANNYMQSYQKLFIASQERYDKLANSQSSLAGSQHIAPEYLLDQNNNHGTNFLNLRNKYQSCMNNDPCCVLHCNVYLSI